MKNNKLSRVLNRILLTAVTLILNVLVFAQQTPPPVPIEEAANASGGGGGNGPGERVPIDMYEGALLLLAIALIIGFYYYNKRRKLA